MKSEDRDSEDRIIYTLEDEGEDFTIDIVKGEFIVQGPAAERLMGR